MKSYDNDVVDKPQIDAVSNKIKLLSDMVATSIIIGMINLGCLATILYLTMQSS